MGSMGSKTLSLPQVIGLIAVVVLLVFFVTLASLYLPGMFSPGGGGHKPDKGPAPQQLVWADPDDAGGPPPKPEVMERGAPGYRNFWFRNDSDKEVLIRANNKGCRCTAVELCTELPPELAAKQTELDAHTDDPSIRWVTLEKEKAVEIPPHARGGVRLRWRKETSESLETFWAEMGTESGGVPGTPRKLVAQVAFIPPLQVSVESNLREQLKENEKENVNVEPNGSQTVTFLIWSPTRAEFRLKAQPPALPHPCVVWGEPQKLTAEECDHLAQRDGLKDPKVRCAYRVPVTIHERTPDGRGQMALGPYRRSLTLTSDDDIDPVTVSVSGRVHGEISVLGSHGKGVIDLGQVRVGEPKSETIYLSSRVPGLKLEADPDWLKNKPEFLQEVTLAEEEPAAAGVAEKRWRLTVIVSSDKPLGNLPRDESVIVLRTNGDPPRQLRIPVTGNVYKP